MVEQHFGKVQIQVQFLVGAPNNAQVVQLVGDSGLRSRTVWVRIPPWAPIYNAVVVQLVGDNRLKICTVRVRIPSTAPNYAPLAQLV